MQETWSLQIRIQGKGQESI